jgi:hypothetical protein
MSLNQKLNHQNLPNKRLPHINDSCKSIKYVYYKESIYFLLSFFINYINLFILLFLIDISTSMLNNNAHFFDLMINLLNFICKLRNILSIDKIIRNFGKIILSKI